MSSDAPRLRMFAGPNGSGKTTVTIGLHRRAEWFGIYINPDEVEKAIRETGSLPLEPFELATTTEEIQQFFASSSFLQARHLPAISSAIACHENRLYFSGVEFNSYYASVLSAFLRQKALESAKSFSFETVMSSPDKVDLLRAAQARGFRTYLYFIATEDPAINIQRVKNRVAEGGHDVPEAKIISRYYRSLSLLVDAIRFTNRAFFFDTSEEEAWYFAEATDGSRLDLNSDEMPNWFAPVWNQFGPARSSSI